MRRSKPTSEKRKEATPHPTSKPREALDNTVTSHSPPTQPKPAHHSSSPPNPPIHLSTPTPAPMASPAPAPAPTAPAAPSVTETYNALGASYEAAFAAVPAQLRVLQSLQSQLAPRSRVLDLGSGTGRPTAAALAAAGHAVAGIDISPVMVAAARARVPGAAFDVADARTYEPPPGELHAVTAFFSFIAEVSLAQILALPGRVAAWLRPGGVFVSGWVCPPGLRAENVPLRWMGRDVVVSVVPPEELVRAMEDAGFEVLEKVEELYLPKAVEAGICSADEVWEEPHVFIVARKK